MKLPRFDGSTTLLTSACAATPLPVDKTNHKAKKKSSGKKLQTKGSVNGLDVGDFFPDGATRIVRITNPTCGVTTLRLKRVGDLLFLASTPIDGQSSHTFQ